MSARKPEEHVVVLEAMLKLATEERNEARHVARVLVHAYDHDSRPPASVVEAARAYPVRP